ncbi:GNAT family N-acetyltransferase [Streptomyces sp. NPDC101169]|uniref:GNAT family N-acetyltransferase n=1 Tax=unclassified Streptomyces TaxID=2593676 RepID=UPI0038205923
MHGLHARRTSTSLIGRASTAETAPPGHVGVKHSHRGRRAGRLRRRVLAYRAIEFLSTHIPDDPGPGDECLLLVHTRQVVGQVRYRICTDCAQGVITAVVIDERFQSTGLGTRALSHLRSRHPGLTWRSTLHKRTTRDLLRRMRIPTTTSATPCLHAHQTLSAPAGPVLAGG